MTTPIAAVEVNVGVNTAQVVTGINKGRAAVRKGTTAMATDARRGVGVMRTEFAKFGQQVAGAPAAIAAASNAMVAFGGKSAGAIGAVGGAFASLFASGFTPLGIAIAGATLAFAHFASRSDEAMEKVTKELEASAAAAKKTRDSIAGMKVELKALRRGERISAIEKEIALLDERLRKEKLALGQNLKFGTELREQQEKQVISTLKEIRALEERLRIEKEIVSERRELSRIERERLKFKPTPPRFSVPEQRVMTREELFDEMGFQKGPTQRDLEDRPVRPLADDSDAQAAFEAELDRIRAAQKERDRIAKELRLSRVTFDDLFGLSDEKSEDSTGKGPSVPDPQVFTGAASAASGLTSALGDIARGSQEASDAIRDFGVRFVDQMASMILQATLLRTIMGALGFTQTPTGSFVDSASVPAAAHGGTYRVLGSGGIDSQLVALKASPGELIRVTNGANSGGGEGGPVNVALTVRPPAVIADEVMARSSSRARAAVTASALSRPGRRGRRAR